MTIKKSNVATTYLLDVDVDVRIKYELLGFVWIEMSGKMVLFLEVFVNGTLLGTRPTML